MGADSEVQGYFKLLRKKPHHFQTNTLYFESDDGGLYLEALWDVGRELRVTRLLPKPGTQRRHSLGMVLPPRGCQSELYSSSSTLAFGKQSLLHGSHPPLLPHPSEATTAPFHQFSKAPARAPAPEEKKLVHNESESSGVRWRRVKAVPSWGGTVTCPTRSCAVSGSSSPQRSPAQPLPPSPYFTLPCSGKVAAGESSNSSLLLTRPPMVCSSLPQGESRPRG